MLKLGSALFLLLVQITSLSECLGPYHASVDDYGQAYSVDSNGAAAKMGPFMDSVTTSYAVGPAPAATQYIAIAAANIYPPGWSSLSSSSRQNPASIILSSDPDAAAGDRIVTDTTWKCQTYPVFNPTNAQIDQRAWPGSSEVPTKIKDLTKNFASLLDATEVPWNPFFLPRIQLGAKRIWYAGLNEEGIDKGITPTNNVICLKKLAA